MWKVGAFAVMLAQNGRALSGKTKPRREVRFWCAFGKVGLRYSGPLPISDLGNKYLLIVEDYFSKWTEAYPIPNQEVKTVADVLVHEFVSRYGVPGELHSDQGRNFGAN